MPRSTTSSTLVVRHDPAHVEESVREVRQILDGIGEPDAIVRPASVPGTLKVIPEGDPHEAQEAIALLQRSATELFRFTTGWTVVDTWVPTDLEEIRRAVAAYQMEIGATDSWKVAVHPAQTALHRQTVIDAVTPLIHNAPVDLEDPMKEIRIDILGDETGIGLLDRSELFRSTR